MFHAGRSSTKHHCPGGGGRGNCRPTRTHCDAHQKICREHHGVHLKTEECPRCKTKRVTREKQQKKQEGEEKERREREAKQRKADEEAARKNRKARHTEGQRQQPGYHGAG
ncbi:MAG: hypothetical protein LQ348_004287 [Seirophora lacunosa]|nr:MAG: hypothetical protein LQ348_004287 [Seirophora lacunosa]